MSSEKKFAMRNALLMGGVFVLGMGTSRVLRYYAKAQHQQKALALFMEDWALLHLPKLEKILYEDFELYIESKSGVPALAKPMSNKYKGWYDVQDSKGVWRLSKCVDQKDQTMLIHLDGWSNKYDTIHCSHSKQLQAPRKHTRGLTTQQPHPLREPFEDFKQVTNTHNKLKLLLNSSPETLEVEQIVSNGSVTSAFFRIELLVMVDSILTLPFDFQNIHLGLEINKFFSDIVTFVSKVLERSSNFLQLNEDPKRKALQDACYELFVMLRSIFGLNSRHDRFFGNSENMFIKKEGFIECFLKTEAGGLLLANSYLRNIVAHSQSDHQSFETNSQLVIIIMELYERRLLTEDQNSRLLLLVDTITNYLRFAAKNEQVNTELSSTLQGTYIMNMLENMYIKLRPTKKFQIQTILGLAAGASETRGRKRSQSGIPKELQTHLLKQSVLDISIGQKSQIFEDKPKPFKKKQEIPLSVSPPQPTKTSASTMKLEERIAKLQAQLVESKTNQQMDILQKFLKAHEVSKPVQAVVLPKQADDFDFNQLAFLNAIQYHLSMNEHEEVKKLVNWRKKILQLATIVGWDIALAVAKNTRQKLTIETKDILSTNIAYLKKMYSL